MLPIPTVVAIGIVVVEMVHKRRVQVEGQRRLDDVAVVPACHSSALIFSST